MWLVSQGARDACLFATSDLRFKSRDFEIFLVYAKAWNLNIVKDPVGPCCVGNHSDFPRYLVYRKCLSGLEARLQWHDDLALILGISYKKEDWWLDCNDRTCFQIRVEIAAPSQRGRKEIGGLFVEMSREPEISRRKVVAMVHQWNYLIQSASHFPESIFGHQRPILTLREIFHPRV